MSENSPKINLPYIQPAQAQKHITHNEAIEVLDAVTQLNVQQFDALDPPALPDAGETFAIGAAPTGDWAGHAHQIATHTGSGWMFLSPSIGWRAWGEEALRVWDGSAWVAVVPSFETVDQLGINSTASEGDRLSVASDSTLLTHDGAGHQLKLNKATAGDTASVLFQSNWTGHAEMGLSGDTNFAVKVSADGGTWISPLVLDSTAQEVRLAPDGTTRITASATALTVDVPITGSAVQSSSLDISADKLLKVGAFGLGAPGSGLQNINSTNNAIPPGFYHIGADATGGPSAETHHLIHTRRSASGGEAQLALAEADGAFHIRTRDTGGWSNWQQVATKDHYTGDLSDPASGPIFERGTNANGDYTRLADGTQICWHTLDMDYSWARELFKTWNFPALFASAAKVFCSIDYASLQATLPADELSTIAVEGATTSNSHLRLMRAAGQTDFTSGDVVSVHVMALGRWQ